MVFWQYDDGEPDFKTEFWIVNATKGGLWYQDDDQGSEGLLTTEGPDGLVG